MFMSFSVGSIQPKITPELKVEDSTYVLCGLIYLGSFHFVTRVVYLDGTIWYNDGIATGGMCIWEGQLQDYVTSNQLQKVKEKKLAVMIYVRL